MPLELKTFNSLFNMLFKNPDENEFKKIQECALAQTGLYVRKFKKPKNGFPTLIFMHGLGSSGDEWEEIINHLNPNFGILSFDFLGFGKSKNKLFILPNEHARKTKKLLNLLLNKEFDNLIFTANSFGCLITLDIYKNFKPKQVILISPPIYKHFPFKNKQDKFINKTYKRVLKYPYFIPKLSQIAEDLNLVPKGMYIDQKNLHLYTQTFRHYILNPRNYLQKLKNIKTPTKIILGLADPLIIYPYFKETRENENVKIINEFGLHGVAGINNKKIAKIINKSIK